MNTRITPQTIYQEVADFPDDSLFEIWQYIEFVRFKSALSSSPRIVKLGGLLKPYAADISEEEITMARQEMWGHFGKFSDLGINLTDSCRDDENCRAYGFVRTLQFTK